MDLRQLRGLEIAARHKVTFTAATWLVPSQSSAGQLYRGTLGDRLGCQCDDFQLHQKACKHVIAAQIVCAREYGGKGPEILADVIPVRPTWQQNWPLYNQTQQTEKYRFRKLLFELCRDLPDPPQPSLDRGGGGRRWPTWSSPAR
jgi:hypothetical protein